MPHAELMVKMVKRWSFWNYKMWPFVNRNNNNNCRLCFFEMNTWFQISLDKYIRICCFVVVETVQCPYTHVICNFIIKTYFLTRFLWILSKVKSNLINMNKTNFDFWFLFLSKKNPCFFFEWVQGSGFRGVYSIQSMIPFSWIVIPFLVKSIPGTDSECIFVKVLNFFFCILHIRCNCLELGTELEWE